MSVNESLTVKRPRRERETSEYASFARRAVRAYSRRVGEAGDVESLAGMLALSRDLDGAIAQAVKGLREDHGYSWADIASRLGVTRQACQQRWGR